jgi:zinc transport system ATP-binding protein
LSPLVVELESGAVAIAGRPVLRGIDLTVRSGEFVALMGVNGSGKSTLVRALTGLRPLASGSLRLFGTPFDSFHEWHRIGFVPQRGGAASGVPASVREVVASGRLTRRRLLRPLGRADRAAISEALEVVGLAHRAGDRVSALSGGQQQRVLIARALAGAPELFFLDEPTAGVDLPNQQVLADSLATLSGRGATIVLVAHELGPMAPLVDRAAVMRDGRVVYDGPPLTDQQVHQPGFGGHRADLALAHLDAPYPDHRHDHHHDHDQHHGEQRDHHDHHDHAPHVGSPLDRPGEETSR